MRRRGVAPRRLAVIMTLVASLVLTLVARLSYVELLDPHKPTQTAGLLHPGDIVVPAPRGIIVDSTGRVLVGNSATTVLTVDQDRLAGLPDHGRAVLTRLGRLLHRSPALLTRQITPCSPSVGAPCWTGEPYQPVPVADHLSTAVVLAVSEHREQYPGVAVQTRTQPYYPNGSLAGHVLGYTAQITAADKKRDPSLTDADTIGVSGLEQEYDSVLRGTDGLQTMNLDPQGYSVSAGGFRAPVQGDTLVTSIDARLEKLATRSLDQQIRDSRRAGKPATSGAVVAMDPQTGRILAVASYPHYDPQQFIGGISAQDYAKLIAPAAGDPLLSRAVAGQYAPGSTFKLITASSLVSHHEIDPNTRYGCPGSVSIDGRVKTNYDSEVLGDITLRDALGYSCDTYFYVPAAAEYYADQARVAAGKAPHEYLQRMAAAFGVGREPGVDLPAAEQATGSYADRESRLARWKANRAAYCAAAKKGYPNVADPLERAYLTQLASENCTDGWRYRAGDNADMAIGQGETTMSPLQLALAYSALVNGGRIWEPKLGWAVLDSAGKLVRTVQPVVHNTVPVRPGLLDYIADSLNFGRGWAVSGAFAYLQSPYRGEIGGKTGTAEVFGHQDTSWLATWGPIYRTPAGHVRARFVLVGMVEQAGTGATAAGPMLKRIWDGLLGANGSAPILRGERPATRLPVVSPRARVPR